MEKREFKVGDKVKIPKTKNTGMSINDEHIQRHLANSKFDYMTITHIYLNKTLVCAIHTEMEGEPNWNFKAEDLEHYEEEFVLPEKWCVKDCTEVTKYGSKRFKHSSLLLLEGRWLCVDESIPNYWYETDKNRKDYTEITFEQFQKYVLKQETMEKEIEGYVLIKEYPGSKGLGYFEKYTTGELSKYPEFWKPIYKEEKQIIQMYSSNKGMFEIEVVDGKAYYRPENKELPEEWIRDIINSYDEILIQQRNGVNPYNVQIAGLHVGCMKDTRKEDWETVYKLLK